MALSSLSMTLAEYRTAVIAEMGYGSTAYASLDAGEAAEIDRLIKRGERTFWLHPPVDPPHRWSCLRKRGLMDLWADIGPATELVVNGTFTDDLGAASMAGWTLGAGWSGPTAKATATLTSASLTQTTAPLTVGSTYRVTFRHTVSVGSCTLYAGTTAGPMVNASGTTTGTVVCAGNGGLTFTGTGFTGTIDSVSCVLASELTGSSPTVTMAASGTTMLSSTDAFHESMIGKDVTVYAGETHTITAFNTRASVTVTPAAVGAYSGLYFSIASRGAFQLPSDFESTDTASLVFTEETSRPPIRLIEEREVTAMRATQDITGCPLLAAIRWSTSDGSAAQTQELVVWPTPDQDYQVAMPYAVQPQSMGASTDYPLGGPEIADALLSMILAVCEEAKTGARGDRWLEAEQKIKGAAKRDLRRHNNFIAGQMRADAGGHSMPFDVKSLILSV